MVHKEFGGGTPGSSHAKTLILENVKLVGYTRQLDRSN